MSSTPHAHVSEIFHADWTMDVYFCTQTRRVNTISEKGNRNCLDHLKTGGCRKSSKKFPRLKIKRVATLFVFFLVFPHRLLGMSESR